MPIGEQLNELDRKVLGAAPVDRPRPAPAYSDEVGKLAPLGRSLGFRAFLYGAGALVLFGDIALDKRWLELAAVATFVIVPAMVVIRLSANAFPGRFPEAPADALSPNLPGRPRRLALAAAALATAVIDVFLCNGRFEDLLAVGVGLAAVVLWATRAEVASREESGETLAVRLHRPGYLGRGIYRVATED